MESSSFEDVNRLVRSELYEHMDPEFGKYLAMNLPGCGNIIGVRLDDLKEIARQIADINWKEYLKHAPDDTLEDVVIQGLVLGFAQGKLEEILAYADEFVPKIDNWWVCDSFCSTFVAASMYPEIVWEFIYGRFRAESCVEKEGGGRDSRGTGRHRSRNLAGYVR